MRIKNLGEKKKGRWKEIAFVPRETNKTKQVSEETKSSKRFPEESGHIQINDRTAGVE